MRAHDPKRTPRVRRSRPRCQLSTLSAARLPMRPSDKPLRFVKGLSEMARSKATTWLWSSTSLPPRTFSTVDIDEYERVYRKLGNLSGMLEYYRAVFED